MKKILISAFCALFVSSSLYGECEFEKTGNIGVTFKAYKTPLKIGVGGKFDIVDYESQSNKAQTLEKLLVGAKVEIKTSSVNSNNPGRDAKLAKFFFDTMAKNVIEAEIIKVEVDKEESSKGVLRLDIKMNGVQHEAAMNFIYEKGMIKADGYIDLADFHALASLASINKACYELHQGKTWSDVAIGFELPVVKNCR